MAAAPSSITSAPSRSTQHAIVIWLLIVAGLIFVMVMVGGITRLTRSGLSIVEWKPITGAIPPLTEQSWFAEFAKYKLTPEYLHVNFGMSLAEFKEIFYMEWAHRLLGRVIFAATLIPLIYFWLRKQIPRSLLPKLIAVLITIALQGALGWFMVFSGLNDIPRVSPYRLTAHLGLAIGIYAYTLWVIFDLRWPQRSDQISRRVTHMSWLVTSLVGLMILVGGFVAGTKAGYIFNTFPLMNGQFVPPGMYALQPWWTNLFENVATVQFNHRMLAYLLAIVGAIFYWLGITTTSAPHIRRALHLFVAALATQIAIGIATLLLIVPVWLGALHQGGALVVLTIALYLSHSLRPARN